KRYGNGKMVSVGAAWQPARLSKVLKNTVYVGVHTMKSQRGGVERAVPALVDNPTWDAVQAQLRRNQCLPKNTVHRLYLLRSLISCGLCGSRYIGMPVSRRNGHDFYYRCGAQTTSHRPEPAGRCPAKIIKAAELEDLIWQDCRAFIRDPEKALAEVHRQLGERRSQSDRVIEEQHRLQQALGEKALERDRIMTLFRRGRIALQDAEMHLDVIERETAELRTALGAIQAQQDLAEAFT